MTDTDTKPTTETAPPLDDASFRAGFTLGHQEGYRAGFEASARVARDGAGNPL